jgi:hypothetical protein
MAVATCLTMAACSIELDPGRMVTRDYELAPFDSVTIDAPFEVIIRQGDLQTIELEVAEGAVDDLTVDVVDGRLLLDLDRSFLRLGDDDLIARITVAELAAIDASNASIVVAPDLDLDMLDLQASGASIVRISGTVERLDLRLSGASLADITSTSISTATVTVSGASSADFDEGTARIDGSLSGASRLSVAAATDVRVDTSGASSINRQ